MSRNSGSCKWTMADGRAFTDYSPNCQLEEGLQAKYAPGASSEYRHFLQHNACGIMKELRDKSAFEHPGGCRCNYNHPPHDAPSAQRYSWQPSAGYFNNKNKDFNRPILAPNGRYTNYC